ncbi:MAG: hypothetical protein KIT58_00720 [Planctomycetota bacterium]|nr:hypothetical protein [Planctomycetota bacterium]
MTSDPKDSESKEQRALNALIAQALRSVDQTRLPKPGDPAPTLEPDDERAFKALGDDLVKRIMSGGAGRAKKSTSTPRRSGRPELAGALHRGGDEDGELTDRAREEIERKIREIEAADDETRDEPEDDESPNGVY